MKYNISTNIRNNPNICSMYILKILLYYHCVSLGVDTENIKTDDKGCMTISTSFSKTTIMAVAAELDLHWHLKNLINIWKNKNLKCGDNTSKLDIDNIVNKYVEAITFEDESFIPFICSERYAIYKESNDLKMDKYTCYILEDKLSSHMDGQIGDKLWEKLKSKGFADICSGWRGTHPFVSISFIIMDNKVLDSDFEPDNELLKSVKEWNKFTVENFVFHVTELIDSTIEEVYA